MPPSCNNSDPYLAEIDQALPFDDFLFSHPNSDYCTVTLSELTFTYNTAKTTALDNVEAYLDSTSTLSFIFTDEVYVGQEIIVSIPASAFPLTQTCLIKFMP